MENKNNKEEKNNKGSIFKRNIIRCIGQGVIFRTENRTIFNWIEMKYNYHSSNNAKVVDVFGNDTNKVVGVRVG